MSKEATPLSPCIGICKLDDATGLCDGCGRSLAEIRGWKTYSDEEKRRIMALLKQRG